ncbi:MAG: phosphotransferase [Bryobacterales bacterium]|nr:phosphotransferase [Bryobacterales bacterium]
MPFPRAQALVQVPALLRRLHLLPAFPKAFNYTTAHNFFVWRLRSSGLLRADEVEEVFDGYKMICAAYPRLDVDSVSCHMDLRPENVLFDGRRVWLVDWRAAFVNDRFFDLANLANFVVTDEADERTFLGEYFGRPPGEYESARFFLMCQVMHMLSAAVYLWLGSAGMPACHEENPPSFRDFHDRIWAGQIDLTGNASMAAYGAVHWRQLLSNIRHPRFHDSLGIVNRRPPYLERSLLLPAAP